MQTDMLRIGLPDVALLARVQRPSVSKWISRHLHTAAPFPDPVDARGNQSFYDGNEVVCWLEATGLGNNPDARVDLAAFAALDDPGDEDAAFAGLTGLLCLSRFAARLPVDPAEILDLADEIDPDDEFLYRELEGLGSRLEPFARYAALLIDAAYNAAAAFEHLMSRRTRRPGTGHARAALAPVALHLVASLARALGTQAEIEAPVYVDPVAGSSDLLVELDRRADDEHGVTVATPPGDGQEQRLAHRRLQVHDITRIPLRDDGHGGFDVPANAVLLTQFPAPQRPGMTELEVLRTIENLVLGSRHDALAVVIAPAEALTDRLRGEPATVRDDILRTDRVRGVVRLPRGLLPRRSRARLAVWCLGPPGRETRPDGTTAEPRTLVADLADTTVDDAVIADLVTDLVAGMRDVRSLVAHSARFTRAVPTRTLLVRTGDLVEPAPSGPRAGIDVDVVSRIGDLRVELDGPLPPPHVPEPLHRYGTATAQKLTLGDAARNRELRVRPGLRLDRTHLEPTGGVRVVGPETLVGRTVGLGIDRLVLAARYPRSQFTEPGDVVFCTAPRPAAVVDIEGGSVVAYPARVLRSRTARLPPGVLATAINSLPESARTWRAWTVSPVPTDQAGPLGAILDDLARHRIAVASRLATIDRLTTALVDGVAAGQLDLVPHDRQEFHATSNQEAG